MNTLRQALQEYLNLRRGLGFKLKEAGKALLDFVNFMQQHRASYITQALALAWAQQPANVQPAHWAQRLSFVRGFATRRDPRLSRRGLWGLLWGLGVLAGLLAVAAGFRLSSSFQQLK